MTAGVDLVLASTSRYRQELLSRLDRPFVAAAPRFDEDAAHRQLQHLPTLELAMALARGKAESLRPEFPRQYILAADQIASLPGPPRELLRKPANKPRAIEQLMQLSGKVHHLTTAVVLLHPDGTVQQARDEQVMTMRGFSRAEAEAYVQRHEPLDSVGSYRIEDAGISLFESIEGKDHTGIIGLPLVAVCRLLRVAGLLPFC